MVLADQSGGELGQAAPADERALHSAISEMLGRADFMLPLAAAERQFRDHYYGLNSAALLEDLFFDALGNFLRQTRPQVSLTRPPAGQKGWDYEYSGLRLSHKVSQELGVVAALWDATKRGVTDWSFSEPIVYVLGSNNPRTHVHVAVPGVGSVQCRALSDLQRPESLDRRTAFIVNWPGDSAVPRLLRTHQGGTHTLAIDELPFKEVWAALAEHLAAGGRANEFEVLVTNRPLRPLDHEAISTMALPTLTDIAVPFRAGVYVLPRELLQNLEVTTNNRGILIPKPTIERLLLDARELGLFVPFSQWFATYAQERPPDLYSAQRSEYDALFSARSRSAI